MKCFKIEWKGFFSFENAQNRPECRESGIYAIYKPVRGKKQLWYIGKSKEIGKRLSQHTQGFAHILTEKEAQKYDISFGIIYSMEASRTNADISPTDISQIESYFININKPEGNSEATKKGYKGESLLVINLGKIGEFDKVMCHNPDLIPLLKQTLPAKRAKTKSSSGWSLK